MKNIWLCLVLSTLAWGSLSGCRTEERPKQKAAPKAPAPSPPPPMTKASPVLSDAEVKGLVTEWIKAQNGGNFEGYEKFYAPRFEGVKRVGPRSLSFDRKAWLVDRKTMFERPFSVKVEDVQVVASESSAVVQFIQSWSSPTFKDTGPKRMLVVKEGADLRIAREEMLTSTTDGKEESGAPDLRDFAFVWDGVVVFEEMTDFAAVTGHPKLTHGLEAERPILTSALPASRKSLIGEEFTLYGPEGKVCDATIEELFVHVAAQPHFGQVQAWDGQHGASLKASSQERALSLWNLSEMGGRFLAGKVRSQKACPGATWARSKTRPEVPVWHKRLPTEEEKTQALAVLRGHADYKEEQGNFTSSTGLSTPLEEAKGGHLSMHVFESEDGSTYVDTLVQNDSGGCGAGFDGYLWYLLRRQGNTYQVVSGAMGEHARSNWPRILTDMAPQSAFDLDADGVPELAGKYDLFRRVSGRFVAVHNLSPGYYDCPC